MKIARGNTRKIVKLVGEIQNLVGGAKGTVLNDRNPFMMDDLLPMLDKAFDLCLEVTGMYEQIVERPAKKSLVVCSGCGSERPGIHSIHCPQYKPLNISL